VLLNALSSGVFMPAEREADSVRFAFRGVNYEKMQSVRRIMAKRWLSGPADIDRGESTSANHIERRFHVNAQLALYFL
jgi:hypothetical protein